MQANTHKDKINKYLKNRTKLKPSIKIRPPVSSLLNFTQPLFCTVVGWSMSLVTGQMASGQLLSHDKNSAKSDGLCPWDGISWLGDETPVRIRISMWSFVHGLQTPSVRQLSVCDHLLYKGSLNQPSYLGAASSGQILIKLIIKNHDDK